MKNLRIGLRYYLRMMPACLAVTAGCAWLAAVWKIPGVIPTLVLFKAVTLALFFFFSATLRPREFYYYHNLGLSRARLWGTAAAVDGAIFVAAIILTCTLLAK